MILATRDDLQLGPTDACCLALVINLGQHSVMLLSLLAAISPPSATVVQVPPAPPIMSVKPIISAPERMLLAWMPGEARCGDAVAEAKPTRRPWSSLLWGASNSLQPVTYGFTIDTTGRTTGIHRLGAPNYVTSIEDLAPSLAATHFEGGAARTGCTVTYEPRQTALGATPVADLVSYTLTPLSGALPEAGWTRIRGTGNCADAPRPQPLLAAFPDFRALPATPGVKDWSMVSYDLDSAGRPVVVRVITGTGNPALDVAAVAAMSASRFTDGSARQGCFYPIGEHPRRSHRRRSWKRRQSVPPVLPARHITIGA